jgi:hypothetical protein
MAAHSVPKGRPLVADVSEFRHRNLLQRPASSPFVISNAVRGTGAGRWYPTLGWAGSPNLNVGLLHPRKEIVAQNRQF